MTNIHAQLTQLENAQIVHRTPDIDLSYIFKHALTQETAYASLLKQSRREIHRAVAEAMEQIYADHLDEYAPLLAHHFAETGNDAKTFEYSFRAGHQAMQTYACTEAVVLFTRAIDAAQRLEPQMMATGAHPDSPLTDCYLHRGRALEMTGQFTQAVQNYRALESLGRTRNDRSMQLAALVALATIYATPTSISNPEQARTLCTRALDIAREISDRKTEARVLWNLMLLNISQSNMTQAIEYSEQSLAISRDLGMHEQTAITLNDSVRPYMSMGKFDRARTAIGEALEYFRRADNKPMLTDCLCRIAIINLAFGEFDRVIESSQEAQEISASIGNRWGQSYSRFVAGRVYFERGDITLAIETMRDCIFFAEQTGFMVPRVTVRSDLALVFGVLGDLKQGIEFAEAAHKLAIESVPNFESKPCGVLARLYTMNRDSVRAEANLNQGYATLRQDFAQRVLDQLPIASVEIALAQHDYARAIQAADEGLERLAKTGFRLLGSQLLYLKGQAMSGLDTQAARPILLQAKEQAEKIGSRWMLWQICAALGEHVQARDHIEYIAAHCSAELRESFLNLPDVRAVMQTR